MFNNNNNKETTMQNDKKTLDQQFSEKTGIDVSKKERGINLDPVIGMGVTRSIGADAYPYTIIDILNVKGKSILKIENDSNLFEHDTFDVFQSGKKYKRETKVEYIEQYTDEKDDRGRVQYRDIKWNEKTKRWNKGVSYYFASVGQRRYYLDPSF